MTSQDRENESALQDKVIRLREWGTTRTYALPPPGASGWFIGAGNTGLVQLIDPSVSLGHAVLFYRRQQWHLRDLDGTAGLRQDGEPRKEFAVTPGLEIGIGATILIAESGRSIALREFCARLLGWGDDRMRAVDHALRVIRLAAARRSALVLQAEKDPVLLAYALHRRVLGPAAPFVVCDPRRGDFPASARSPANASSAAVALQIAAGGSLCVRSRSRPHGWSELLRLLEEADPRARAQLIVCMTSHERSGILTCAMPIEVPPLGIRGTELPRIIQAYVDEALAALHATQSSFSDEDHDWVMMHAASLPEIEKATLRIVALRKTGNHYRAAELLGIAPISLSRWLDRRILPTGRVAGAGIA